MIMKNITNILIVFGLTLGILSASFGIGSTSAFAATTFTCNSAVLEGDITVTPSGVQTSVWFEYGTSNSFGNTTLPQNITSTGAMQVFSQSISGLSPNTTYNYRAVAQNSQGTFPGQSRSFVTPACSVAPSINTDAPTNITQASATINGLVNGNGQSINAWFEWGTSSSYGNTTNQMAYGTGSTNYNFNLTNLLPNTAYYYRAVAQSGSATAIYGSAQSFTTSGSSATQLTVNTNLATNVFQASATLNGFVTKSSASITNVNAWFEYGTSPTFGNVTSQSFISGNSSIYSQTVSGLNSNTLYYYRAVAQSGTDPFVYGATQTFTTGNFNINTNNPNTSGQCYINGVYQNCNTSTGQPYITTYSATGVGDTFAVLNGYVDPNGIFTTRWFEWGTSNGYLGSQTIKIGQGLTAGAFNQTLTGLQPNTTYYFRAVAQGSSGQVYGNILSFTSTGGGNTIYNTGGGTNLQAITLLATNIGQTSGRVNGLATINNPGVQSPSTNGYFEWGTDNTLNISNTTPTQAIGNAPSISFFASLFNLLPNTRYYYRAVVTSSYGTSKGDIMNFLTGNIGTVTTTSSTVVVKKTTSNVVRNSTSQPSLMALDINQDGLCIARGNIISYTVNYKNTSSRALKDVVLRVLLPQELAYNDSDRGTYSDKDTSVVLPLGNVASGDGGTMTVRTEVVRGAEIGKTIVVTAYLVDTDTVSGAQEEVVAYSLNQICQSRNGQAALSFFGGDGFLPDTLLEWLLLILVILGLIILARNFYGEKEKEKTN